jgi:WD40 repeat protein
MLPEARIDLLPDTTPCCLAAFPGSLFFVCGCADGSVLLCNAEGAEIVRTLQDTCDAIQQVTISNDANRVIAATDSGMIYVWDSITGAQPQRIDTPYASITALAVLGSDQLGVISQSEQGAHVELLALSDGSRIRHRMAAGVAHTLLPDVHGLTLVRSTDDGRIICCTEDSADEWLSIEAGQEIHTALLSPKRGALLVALEQVRIAAYDLESGRGLASLETPAPLSATAISSNEGYLIAGCHDGTIHIYELLL